MQQDVVETQLMREISSRSQSMFEAAGVLQDLHRTLCRTLEQIKGLREHLSEMDEQTYTSALAVAALQRRRTNLAQAAEHLQAMEQVVASRSALQCLLEAQDYAGSLELLGNLSHMVDKQSSLGLRAFRETGAQVRHSRRARNLVEDEDCRGPGGERRESDPMRLSFALWRISRARAHVHTWLYSQVQETISIVESLLSCEFLNLARNQDMHKVMERAIAESSELASVCDAG